MNIRKTLLFTVHIVLAYVIRDLLLILGFAGRYLVFFIGN